MKKIFILFLLSISLFYAKAQTSLKNNAVTLSTGWEETIYRNIKDYFSSTTATAHPQNLWQLTLGVGRRF